MIHLLKFMLCYTHSEIHVLCNNSQLKVDKVILIFFFLMSVTE